MTLPRRTFLIAIGGGVASASLAFGLWRSGPWGHPDVDQNPIAACCGYAHYSGWLVTPADIDKLNAAAK